MEMVQWLRGHEIQHRVIGTTDPDLCVLIPALTTNWTFVPVADRTMASQNEILTRYLVVARLAGNNSSEVAANLAQWTGGARLWLNPEYIFFQSNGPGATSRWMR